MRECAIVLLSSSSFASTLSVISSPSYRLSITSFSDIILAFSSLLTLIFILLYICANERSCAYNILAYVMLFSTRQHLRQSWGVLYIMYIINAFAQVIKSLPWLIIYFIAARRAVSWANSLRWGLRPFSSLPSAVNKVDVTEMSATAATTYCTTRNEFVHYKTYTMARAKRGSSGKGINFLPSAVIANCSLRFSAPIWSKWVRAITSSSSRGGDGNGKPATRLMLINFISNTTESNGVRSSYGMLCAAMQLANTAVLYNR